MLGETFGKAPHEILELGIHKFALAWKAGEAIWETRAQINESEGEDGE